VSATAGVKRRLGRCVKYTRKGRIISGHSAPFLHLLNSVLLKASICYERFLLDCSCWVDELRREASLPRLSAQGLVVTRQGLVVVAFVHLDHLARRPLLGKADQKRAAPVFHAHQCDVSAPEARVQPTQRQSLPPSAVPLPSWRHRIKLNVCKLRVQSWAAPAWRVLSLARPETGCCAHLLRTAFGTVHLE
jgi:hypothetical protein